MIAAITLAVGLSITVGAWGTPTDCIPGDSQLDGDVDGGDVVTTRYIVQGILVDLTVISNGCCNITVTTDWGSAAGTVLAGDTVTFYNLWAGETATLTADDSDPGCDFDGWTCGSTSNPEDFVMVAAEDTEVTGYCCVAPAPEPCCWCIYAVDWWAVGDPGDPKPAGDPDLREYFALHTEYEYPPCHYEFLGWPFTIPPPSYHQETLFYAGNETPPNGYGEPEWTELESYAGPPQAGNPRVMRVNPTLGLVYAFGQAYYGGKCNLINYKSRFDLHVPALGGDASIYSATVGVVDLVGNAGWPYAVGNQWATCTFAPPVVDPAEWSMSVVTGMETIFPPAFPGGISCYVVESWSMIGAPPTFTPDKMTSKNWYSNDYGCTIMRENYVGSLYLGYEDMELIHYCTDPDFPFDPELPEWILPH